MESFPSVAVGKSASGVTAVNGAATKNGSSNGVSTCIAGEVRTGDSCSSHLQVISKTTKHGGGVGAQGTNAEGVIAFVT